MRNKDFAIFILTHGRADNVITYKTLKKTDYEGPVYFVVDDQDSQLEKYKENFGEDRVMVFSKDEIVKKFDVMDNFDNNKTIVYARNACFDIAKKLGVKYFMQLDDDYSSFEYRYTRKMEYQYHALHRLNDVLDCLLDFYKKTNVKSIALAQGGDFLGGKENGLPFSMLRIRKCMNTFICSTERPFTFIGKFNEDVNVYAGNARFGDVFLTLALALIIQKQTQKNKGGMTEDYLANGTYIKSFYTVMVQPSSVTIGLMGNKRRRLHHRIKGANTYPMIIPEKYKYGGYKT